VRAWVCAVCNTSSAAAAWPFPATPHGLERALGLHQLEAVEFRAAGGRRSSKHKCRQLRQRNVQGLPPPSSVAGHQLVQFVKLRSSGGRLEIQELAHGSHSIAVVVCVDCLEPAAEQRERPIMGLHQWPGMVDERTPPVANGLAKHAFSRPRLHSGRSPSECPGSKRLRQRRFDCR
jgi:hypothetical protein